MKNILWQYPSDKPLSFSVSILIHLILLWLGMYLKFSTGASGKGRSSSNGEVYIHFQSIPISSLSVSSLQTPSAEIISVEEFTEAEGVVKAKISKKKERPPASIQANLENKVNTTLSIDKRGLYPATGVGGKGEGGNGSHSQLDLKGWIWDFIPAPQDPTPDIGKIVFEIHVNDAGEVIMVKTLEKTVGATTEKIYKEALMQLTFSKTHQQEDYKPISIGKVTFYIQGS